jgi:hypothetical protein
MTLAIFTSGLLNRFVPKPHLIRNVAGLSIGGAPYFSTFPLSYLPTAF